MNRHHGTDVRDTLRISRTKDATEVLGPGTRAVIWVMGCELRCRGCIAPETHPHAGSLRETEELGAWSAAVAKDGLTVSGGEPMLQSAAVARLVDIARERRPDLHVMIYTGYRLDWLLRYGSDLQRALLTRVDLLVDGPYVERFHAPVKWRGSRNQRMIDLSGRTPLPRDDDPAGVELELTTGLTLDLTGVPPVPGVRRWLDSLQVRHDERPWDDTSP